MYGVVMDIYAGKGSPMSQGPFTCRICGQNMVNPQGLGRHESWHVLKGEAKYTGPKRSGQQRPIEILNPPQPPIQPIRSFKIPHKPYDGTPCEICGKADFADQFCYDMHRNHHPRRGEATWVNGVSRGPNKRLVPTKLGRDRFSSWLDAKNQEPKEQHVLALPNGQQITLTPEQAIHFQEQQVGPHECADSRLVKTLRTSLMFLEVAAQIQDMDPESVLRFLAAVKGIGNLPRR